MATKTIKTCKIDGVLDIGDNMSLPEDIVVLDKDIDDKFSLKCTYEYVFRPPFLRRKEMNKQWAAYERCKEYHASLPENGGYQ